MNVRNAGLLLLSIAITVLAGAARSAVTQAATYRSYFPVALRGPVSTGTPVVKINFQPFGADIPPGYFPDSGATFTDRGNGFSYGWNADTSSATRQRHSPWAPDQRFNTLIHLQKEENPDAIWEIALPPGIYDVYAVAGDPDFYDGYMHTLIEGRTLVDGAPSADRRFVSGLATTVAVTDGRLTIRSGPKADNNKLAFLEVYKIADLPGMVEFRGLWVTRFDWTTSSGATRQKIDEIIDNAAGAGFNALMFQVRAAGDAYYPSGLEPWARRASGEFGKPPNPYWDPLAYVVERAHQRGLQLHAYVNVYPVWDSCPSSPPENVSPRPPYYLLRDAHGTTGGKLNGLQWQKDTGQIVCSGSDGYFYATPASAGYREHMRQVVADLVNRYDIDGIHLDRVRYAGRTTSCDPVSRAAYGGDCFTGGNQAYENWQREQVNTMVRDLYQRVIVPARRDVWLSAAVWHTYKNRWGWIGYSQGYYDYYQDSQGWMAGGYIDAIMPMIYSGNPNTFPLDRWKTLTRDFQENSAGRYVIPGIGGASFDSFDEVAAKIDAARQLGTAGHAIFSYTELRNRDYFDDLAAGPYAVRAFVPPIPWHD